MSHLLDKYEKSIEKKYIKISGAGRVAGGRYYSVSISGAGTVDGDLEADVVKVAGSASFNGDVRAGGFVIAGAVKVQGDVTAESVRSAGALSIAGVLKARELKVAGSLKALSVKGNNIMIGGAFRVEGPLEGEHLTISLSDDSRAKLIKGKELKIERSGGGFGFLRLTRLLKRRKNPLLYVETIEAEKVVIRDVIVEGDVKADSVEILGNGEVKGTVTGSVVRR